MNKNNPCHACINSKVDPCALPCCDCDTFDKFQNRYAEGVEVEGYSSTNIIELTESLPENLRVKQVTVIVMKKEGV